MHHSAENDEKPSFIRDILSGEGDEKRMEWSERMNAALDYIENNLAEEIDLTKVAEKACCSPYHFHRMFYSINDLTPAEYIRRRRLTLAATEIASGRMKIIDIAMKYSYESPTAFTRAFRQMHGVTPRAAREPGVTLTAYPRISFHIELKGGNDMDYKIIEQPAFEVVGKSRQFTLAEGEAQTGIRNFWDEYGPTAECQRLFDLGGKHGQITSAGILGVSLLIDGQYDPFRYAICVEKREGMDTNDYEVYQVPGASWAVFECTAETETDVILRVYSEWFPSTGYEHEMKPSIEVYFVEQMKGPQPSDLRCQYWVPVIKKK